MNKELVILQSGSSGSA